MFDRSFDSTLSYIETFSALSPTSPFPQLPPRLRLVAVLAPACLLSTFLSSYILVKTTGLLTGFVLFGDPIIWRGIAYLNSNYPHWERLLELQK